MKMKLITVFAVTAILALTSCDKREYTCSCILNGGKTENLLLGRMNNNAAQKKCVEQEKAIYDQVKSSGGVVRCKVMY